MDNAIQSLESGAISDLIAGMPSIEAVRELEAAAIDLPQVDLKTSHVLHGGMCARTITIPAGTVLTGALTNMDNICVVSGDITVTTDDGPQRLTGFHVLAAKPGFKRAGVTHAETHWTTLWKTDLEDIQAIEDEMTSESERLQTRRPGITYDRAPAIEGGH